MICILFNISIFANLEERDTNESFKQSYRQKHLIKDNNVSLSFCCEGKSDGTSLERTRSLKVDM